MAKFLESQCVSATQVDLPVEIERALTWRHEIEAVPSSVGELTVHKLTCEQYPTLTHFSTDPAKLYVEARQMVADWLQSQGLTHLPAPKRDQMVNVKFTVDEVERLRQEAAQKGLKLSVLVRHRALYAERGPVVTPRDIAALVEERRKLSASAVATGPDAGSQPRTSIIGNATD